jgi:TetR/AcrR family transcriptional regulator, regulator of autoinduction and epiphytic fitness
MARNKRNIDAQIKRDEIIAGALELFLQHGFDDTSMATVSRRAAIAPNTVYWYFASKDELLLATLDKVLQERASAYLSERFDTPLQRLTWVMAQFDTFKQLMSAVHARLASSPLIRDWHDRYHQGLEHFITAHLMKQGQAQEQAQLMATIGTFVIEGLLSHPHSDAQRQAILNWLVRSKTAPPPGD